MQAISLGDTLTVIKSSEDSFTCSDPSLSCDKSNLVMQAVTLFRQKTNSFFPIKIHLEKKIPKEAGLGGGSSNLATTLWALNQFLKKPYSTKTLKNWAAELSSDAPFFFSSGTGFAKGRGESVKDINPPMDLSSFWIAKPAFELKTPQVYENFNPINFNDIKDPYQMIKKVMQAPCKATNDLESASFFLKPKLKEVKHDLFRIGFKHVLMTGSGTAFYCLGPVIEPSLKDVIFYPVNSIFRRSDNWYCT